jgi:hypothetical protein
MKNKDDSLKVIQKEAFRNRAALKSSRICGCYFCLRMFPYKKIKDWADKGQTAICPYCQVDAVLYDKGTRILTSQLLKQMHHMAFAYLSPKDGSLEILNRQKIRLSRL